MTDKDPFHEQNDESDTLTIGSDEMILYEDDEGNTFNSAGVFFEKRKDFKQLLARFQQKDLENAKKNQRFSLPSYETNESSSEEITLHIGLKKKVVKKSEYQEDTSRPKSPDIIKYKSRYSSQPHEIHARDIIDDKDQQQEEMLLADQNNNSIDGSHHTLESEVFQGEIIYQEDSQSGFPDENQSDDEENNQNGDEDEDFNSNEFKILKPSDKDILAENSYSTNCTNIFNTSSQSSSIQPQTRVSPCSVIKKIDQINKSTLSMGSSGKQSSSVKSVQVEYTTSEDTEFNQTYTYRPSEVSVLDKTFLSESMLGSFKKSDVTQNSTFESSTIKKSSTNGLSRPVGKFDKKKIPKNKREVPTQKDSNNCKMCNIF